MNKKWTIWKANTPRLMTFHISPPTEIISGGGWMEKLYSLSGWTEIYGVGSARMFQLRRPGTWLSSQWVGRLWCLVAVRLIAAADNHVWCCLYLGTAEGQKAGINVPPTTHSASARFEIEIKASLSFLEQWYFRKHLGAIKSKPRRNCWQQIQQRLFGRAHPVERETGRGNGFLKVTKRGLYFKVESSYTPHIAGAHTCCI